MRKSTVIKKCTCKLHKGDPNMSLSDFYRNRTKKDGHSNICKECQLKVNKLNKK